MKKVIHKIKVPPKVKFTLDLPKGAEIAVDFYAKETANDPLGLV